MSSPNPKETPMGYDQDLLQQTDKLTRGQVQVCFSGLFYFSLATLLIGCSWL